MKSLFILVTTFMLGCGSSPQGNVPPPVENNSDSINFPPGSDDPNPCGKPQFVEFKVDGTTYVTQVPSMCDQGPNPFPDDPAPDFEINAWKEKGMPGPSTENTSIKQSSK